MSLYDKISVDIVKPNIGVLVDLFEIYLTLLGGPIYRFTPNTMPSGGGFTTIQFDSNIYYPREVNFQGFSIGGGQVQRPKVEIGNLDGEISNLCRDYNNMLGVIFKHRRTLKKYLDGQAGADILAEWPVETYIINRRSRVNKVSIEFELTPYLDREGCKIPGEIVMRDICLNIYRKYNGATFSTSDIRPCPYSAAVYFKFDDTSTLLPAEDKCSKTLNGCKARYGNFAELPFRGCPGIDRVRR